MLKNRLAAADGAISKYFIGNTGGLYCELMGLKGNFAFRGSRSPLAEQIKAKGTAPFSPGLSSEELQELAAILDGFELYRDTEQMTKGVEAWMVPYLVLQPNTVRLSAEPPLPEGPIAQASAKIQDQLTRALNVNIQSLGITLYRNRATSDVKSISADWHFDRRPSDWMRAFVYLSDVTPDCGPFHFFDREDSAAFCRAGFSRGSQYWQEHVESLSSFNRLLGPRGSGLIANAERVLHRAGNPARGCHRDMFEFIFRPLPN